MISIAPRKSLEASPFRTTAPPEPSPIDRLLEVGRPRVYRRNEVVFHQGDEGTTLYLPTLGRFAMEVGSPDGHILLLAVLLPGDIFGDMSILSPSERRSGTVVALEAASAVVIERQEFDRIRRTDPQVSELISDILANRVRSAVRRIAELAHVPSPLRVLRVLARLTEAYANGDGPTVVSFSQERLARFAGTSRDTVNRVLREAEREGWLDVRRERILVLDCAELLTRSGSI